MKKREDLSLLPIGLENALRKRKIKAENTKIFATADMDFQCNIIEHIFVLTEEKLICGRAKSPTKERIFAGFKGEEPDCLEYDYEVLNVSNLKNPAVYNQVVGGVLKVDISGTERVLCTFTNAYKGRILKLVEILKLLIDKKEVKEDLKFAEKREEFCPKCGTPYPEKNRKICPKCMDKRKIFFRLASYFKPFRFEIGVICLLCILSAMLSAIYPYLSGSILYDGVLSKKLSADIFSPIPIESFGVMLLVLVLTMVAIKLTQQFFGIIQGRIVAKVVPSVVCTIKNKVFSVVQSLSVSFFTGSRTGGLMARVTDDANGVSNIFIDGIPFILPNLFTVVFSFIVMFKLNWMLALAAIIAIPPAVYVSVKLEPRMWHYNSKGFQASRDMRAKLNDNVTGTRVVKAFGREDSESKRLLKSNAFVLEAETNSFMFKNKFTVIFTIAKTLSSLTTWVVGALFVINVFKPQMTYGTLLTFTGYVGLLAGPIDFFSNIFQWWSSSMNSAQRIFEILDAKPDVVEVKEPIRIGELKGEITLKNVTFGYEENRDVLKNINLHIKPGEMLGIVGKSGAGKSTLANLITRLYDANSGDILLDGVNVRDMAFEDIRSAIAMVSQETYIFKGSIFENIAYANSSASRSQVLKAAISAGAHDFICKLPDGYDTLVGSGGRRLSGGEKQRISIARALLADPKILILDEATAAVDTETERKIQNSLALLTKDRTTLSIAHRLSTLRDADKLIVLENGEIAEQGTHSELVAKKGTYFKLLQIQTKALAMRGIGD